jgi:formylglycine-generating enzyme required for sulfatase activity
VVNIAYEDAQAYARWLGRELPTEAWGEFAARGSLEGATYSWGDEYYDPLAGWRANAWLASDLPRKAAVSQPAAMRMQTLDWIRAGKTR